MTRQARVVPHETVRMARRREDGSPPFLGLSWASKTPRGITCANWPLSSSSSQIGEWLLPRRR